MYSVFPSLVNNIALETLHLNVSPLAPEAAHLLPHWLRKGTTRSFKVISFSYFSNFHDLTPEGFEEKLKELDEVLSSPAFPWLSRFQFQPRLIHHRPRRCEETQKKVRAIFPKLIKRGVFWIGIHMPRGQMDPEGEFMSVIVRKFRSLISYAKPFMYCQQTVTTTNCRLC